MPTARFDLPTPDDTTQPWWDAAAEGRLLVVRCAECDEVHYYPRPFCPRCGGDGVSWEEASGDATLYTWSVVYQNDLPPFAERSLRRSGGRPGGGPADDDERGRV